MPRWSSRACRRSTAAQATPSQPRLRRTCSPFYPPRETAEGRDARALQQFQKRIALLAVGAPTNEHWRLAVLFAGGNHRLVNSDRNPHLKFFAALLAWRDHHFEVFFVHIPFLPVSDVLITDRFTVGRPYPPAQTCSP